MAKLAQQTVNDGCAIAAARYKAMPTPREASIAFSYELQGYAKAMTDNGEPLPTTLLKITELVNMLAKANGI